MCCRCSIDLIDSMEGRRRRRWLRPWASLACLASVVRPDAWREEKARVEASVRTGKGAISFLHVHKGGGTTMCALARANGMRTQKDTHKASWAGKNCNPAQEDLFDANKGLPEAAVAYAERMMGPGPRAGTTHAGVAALGRSFFYANEGRLPGALAYGQMAFVAVIRDPLHLAISLLGPKADAARLEGYNNRQLSLFIGCAGSVARLFDRGAQRPVHRLGFEYAETNATAGRRALRAGDRSRGLPVETDPWKKARAGAASLLYSPRSPPAASTAKPMARNVGNPSKRAAAKDEQARSNCVNDAAAKLGPRDLEAAKRRVDRFSLVVPTERIREAMPLFAEKFGWRAAYTRAGTHARAKGAYDATPISRIRDTPGLRAAFQRGSALDRELYAHAVARFDAQLLALPAARAAAPQEAEPEEEALEAAPRDAAEAEDRVAVLGRLRAQGLLQDAEYDAAVAAARRSAGGAAS